VLVQQAPEVRINKDDEFASSVVEVREFDVEMTKLFFEIHLPH